MSRDYALPAGDPSAPGLLAEYLAWDLSRASGILAEIAICWRRAHGSIPGLLLPCRWN